MGLSRKKQLDAYDEQMCDMSKEVKAINKKIKDTCYARNALLPISCLSTEIVQDIFLLLSLPPEDDKKRTRRLLFSTSEQKKIMKWNWLTITKVCRHWRDVALGYPNLWTRLNPFWRVDRLQAHLLRSKGADLYIMPEDKTSNPKFDWEQHFPVFCSLISKHYARIREFHIELKEASYEDIADVRKIFTRGPMTRLRRFVLLGDEYDSFKFLEKYKGAPDSFMSGVQLHHLSLSAFSFPWDHHALRGLSELVIENCKSSEQPTVFELLDILKGCPQLRVLKLNDAGPKSSNTGEISNRSIEMADLRNIHIKGVELTDCKKIFDSIVLKADTILSVGCKSYPFGSPIPIPIWQLDVIGQRKREEAKITINAEGMCLSFRNRDVDESCITFTQLWQPETFETTPDLMCQAFRSVPIVFRQHLWGNVTSLSVDVRNDSDKDGLWKVLDTLKSSAWDSLLEQLEAIRDLEISFPDSVDITASFARSFSKRKKESPDVLQCPNLQSLNLIEASFSYDPEGDPLKFYYTFLNHLALRHKITGKKLRKFSLIQCGGIFSSEYKKAQEMEFSDEVIWELL